MLYWLAVQAVRTIWMDSVSLTRLLAAAVAAHRFMRQASGSKLAASLQAQLPCATMVTTSPAPTAQTRAVGMAAYRSG